MPSYFVMLGPPGAGKGTQAKILSERLGFAHISTGDLFRDNIERKTDLGRQVEEILAAGALVPDEVTVAMVRDRLQWPDCQTGAVLDGFPRTPGQAAALDVLLAEWGAAVTLVPYIRVSEALLVERLTGRRTDKNTGQIYHLKYNPPPPDADLIHRPDDQEDTVRTRLAEYHKNTAPLVEYYRDKGVLKEIDGERAIEAVTEDLIDGVRAGMLA
ncbi:MAG: adenylate kinase [Anaerolineales bacterium]